MLSREQIREVSTMFLREELEKAHQRKFDSPIQANAWRVYIAALDKELKYRGKNETFRG